MVLLDKLGFRMCHEWEVKGSESWSGQLLLLTGTCRCNQQVRLYAC